MARKYLPGETDDQWKARNALRMREYRAKRKAAGNPIISPTMPYEEDRDRRYRKQYGLTTEQVASMLHAQGGKCAICTTAIEMDNRGKRVSSAVDHCHATGKVRGMLCMHCNQGLGKFYDNPDLLRAAIQYLSK